MNREFIVLTRKRWKIFYCKIFFVVVPCAHVHRVQLPLLIEEISKVITYSSYEGIRMLTCLKNLRNAFL